MKKLYSKIAFALLISIFPYSVIGQDDLPPEQLGNARTASLIKESQLKKS